MADTETVYVVFGQTGEYSDHTEWCVAAYPNEEDARAHEHAADVEAKRIEDARKAIDNWKEQVALEKSNKYDPDMEMSYTGTSYSTVKVRLLKSFDPERKLEPTR